RRQSVEERGEFAGVDMGGHEQLLTEGATELGDLPVQVPPRLGDDVPDQGVAVGVDARGRQADEDVAGAHLLGSERSEEHTSELQSRFDLVCRLLLEKKK